MKPRLTLLVAVAAVTTVIAAPAAAVDFSLFGSYLDTDDASDSWGLGGRVAFFDRLQLQVTGTYYDTFDTEILGFEIDNVVGADLDLIPIDVGGAWYFGPDASGFYVGGGATWFFLDSDLGSLDDEFGYYLQLGYQFPGLFIEGLYREAEGTVNELDFPGVIFEDRVDIDLAGYSIHAGWRF